MPLKKVAVSGQMGAFPVGRLTNPQAADVFSRVLGKPVEFVEMPIPDEKEYFQMFHWSMTPDFRRTSATCENATPKCDCRRSSSGSTTRVGTSAFGVSPAPR